MNALPSIISISDRLIGRNCPPGSVASHATYGMVFILSADGLQREVQYADDRRAVPLGPDAPEYLLYEEEFDLVTAWVHVSELQMRSPVRDLDMLFPRNWDNIITSLEARAAARPER